MAPPKKIRLGDMLREHGIITDEQLQDALAEQKQSGRKLGQIFVDRQYLSEHELLSFIARQLQAPLVDLASFEFKPALTSRLTEVQARRFRALVLDETPGGLLVGMSDPTDIFAYDELSRLLHVPIVLAVVREVDLLAAIDTLYRRTAEISNIAEELHQELSESDVDLGAMAETADHSNAPVVRLLQTLFEDAVRAKASDIHIEPDEHELRIRMRIDGVLQEQVMKEKLIAPALVSRLKLVSGLDISEKRLPQDGRFNMKVAGRSIDVRISTMPIQYGESVVMRLLDQSQGILDLEQLGMPQDLLVCFRRHVSSPHGMVLVTGPTGSGKTTTLYAALKELNEPDRKIITVEDPVEYRMSRVNQVQVHPKIGLTFASVLRTALRQDPDVVLVGETRDAETAEIALRASITGHLVLSSLHTNDAVSTAMRLLDMGAEGFTLAAALNVIIAQRLVRRLCRHCAAPVEPDVHQKAWLKEYSKGDPSADRFQHGKGCPRCNGTGYSGRVGVYELLEMNEALADALRRNDQGGFVKAARGDARFRTLVEHALDYARQGITSLDEVIRISGETVQDIDVDSLEAVEPARSA